MQSMTVGDYAVAFNGDFSGDVHLQHHPGNKVYVVPFEVLREIVAEKVRRDRISALEQADAEELLGG